MPWQIGKADATVQEAAAVVQEFRSRNVFHSEATIVEAAEIVVQQAAAAREQAKRKMASTLTWGAVVLSMVGLGIWAFLPKKG